MLTSQRHCVVSHHDRPPKESASRCRFQFLSELEPGDVGVTYERVPRFTGRAGRSSATGAKCEPCKQGTAPSANKKKCDICPAGKVSARGVACDSCQDKTQRPNHDQSKCICPDGTYNSSFGLIFCFEHNYMQDAILLDR